MEIKEWIVDASEINIDFSKILGKGTYCTVYEGYWRNIKIAVKYFNNDFQSQYKIHLQKEFEILVKIHHPNIIQLLGVCFEPFMILLEHMKYGNLHDMIIKYRNYPNCIVYKKKMSWCKDLCLSLIYLHNRRPEFVIHRDLKPTNLLIGRDNILKLSDFGISKIVEKTYQSFSDLTKIKYTDNIGTYYYMSPEIVNSHDRIYDYKVDIWSLGLIFYEIWENNRWIHFVYNDFTTPNDYKKFIIDNDLALIFIKTPKKMRSIIKKCLLKNPIDRPTAQEIYSILGSL